MSEPRVLAEPILVGREKDLEVLNSFLASAMEGKGKTVFISGEAGAGKTRLVAEFLKAAKNLDVTVLTGWCLSNAAVPYFPFFEAFNAYFTGESNGRAEFATDIAGWLKGPSQAVKPQDISPQVWKDQTFAAVAKTLVSISAEKPVILFLDDLHWADSASMALVHYIARVIVSERVLLLATFRSEQLTADDEGRPHPLLETLRLMRREDLYKEVKVANLSGTCVSELARSMLGGDIQHDFAEKLVVESQGNALFVVESLRMLHERKGLTLEHEKWRLANIEFGMPEKIKDIILQRLSVLLHSQRKILEGASVIGEKFDVGLIASIMDQDYIEVSDALDMIERTTSLVRSEGEQFRFDHARSRDAIYDDLSPTLKRAYHNKVAEKLESASKDGKLPLSEMAYHCAQAGNQKKAAKYAILAGQDELARWSNAQAIDHFTYALQNLPPGQGDERKVALEGLGDAYAANSMFGEAVKTFDILATSETGRLQLRAIRKAMDAAYFIWDASDLLLEHAKKATELGVEDRLEMARILADRGRAFGWAASGNVELDLADSDAALQVFEEEYSLADVATALWRSGVLCSISEGLQEKGLGELLRSVAIFKELGDIRKEIEATYWTGNGFDLCFLYSQARQEFAKVLRIGEKLGMFAELSLTCTRLARIDEYAGNLADAVSGNLKSIEYSKKTDAMSGVGVNYGSLIREYSKLGDLKRASECYEEVRSKFTDAARSHYMIAPEVALTRGVYLAANEKWDESNQIFENLIESSKTISWSRHLWKVRVGIDYSWALERQGRFEEAKVKLKEAHRIWQEVEVRFEHASLQAHVMARRQTVIGEELEMRLDLVNVGKKPCTIVKIANMIPSEFVVVSLPSFCNLSDNGFSLREKTIDPFHLQAVKLKVRVTKPGDYHILAEAIFVDDLGETKTSKLNSMVIVAQPPQPICEALPGRMTTGYMELDDVLSGGIPEGYSVVLSASSCDESKSLIRRFLEAGAKAGETTFYVTGEVEIGKVLAETHQSNFYLFLCNPRADMMIQSLPNVTKLKGVESLTEVDIALAKAFHTIKLSSTSRRRACIEIVSDVLLQHHAVITRKWLSALIADLKSRCFTTIAVIDPRMHPPEETQAILGLFDGEICMEEKETESGRKKVLHVTKLYNQRYSEKELSLAKEKLLGS